MYKVRIWVVCEYMDGAVERELGRGVRGEILAYYGGWIIEGSRGS